jgi:CHRD domain-containing protein
MGPALPIPGGTVRSRDIFISLCTLALVATASAQTTYTTVMNGASEVPTINTAATGTATVVLNAAQTQISITCQFHNLIGTYTASHIHGPAPIGVNAGVKWGFLPPTAPWVFSNANHDGTLSNFVVTGLTATDVTNLSNGQFYVNVHSTQFPGGEIRGQLGSAPVPTVKSSWSRVKALYR